MIKRAVFLHDDHYVAYFVNSIAFACVLGGRGNNTARHNDQCHNYYTRLSSHQRLRKHDRSAKSQFVTLFVQAAYEQILLKADAHEARFDALRHFVRAQADRSTMPNINHAFEMRKRHEGACFSFVNKSNISL
jgi:hypothetical protein